MVYGQWQWILWSSSLRMTVYILTHVPVIFKKKLKSCPLHGCTSLNPQADFHPTGWGCALALILFKAITLHTWFLLGLCSSCCLLRSQVNYFLHLTLISTSVLFLRSNYSFLKMKKMKCRWQSWIEDSPVGNQLKSSSGNPKPENPHLPYFFSLGLGVCEDDGLSELGRTVTCDHIRSSMAAALT